MNNPIISVHIPKTGGVTFRELLLDVAQGHVHFDYRDMPIAPPNRIRKIKNVPILALKLARIRRSLNSAPRTVVHGHFIATKYDRHFPDGQLATWLRDPVERLVSQYYHLLRTPYPSHEIWQKLHRHNMTLIEFAKLEELRNIHSKFLDGKSLDEFDFVGITEEFDQGWSLFQRLFFSHIPLKALEARNQNPEKKGKRYELDAGTRNVIVQCNEADMALYDKGKRRFRELCQLHGVGRDI